MCTGLWSYICHSIFYVCVFVCGVHTLHNSQWILAGHLFYAWFTFSSRQHETRWEWECERVHSSRPAHSQPVLILYRSSRKHVGKSVPSQKEARMSCLVIARECECLHLCVIRLFHISPKGSASTRDENVNQALHSKKLNDTK